MGEFSIALSEYCCVLISYWKSCPAWLGICSSIKHRPCPRRKMPAELFTWLLLIVLKRDPLQRRAQWLMQRSHANPADTYSAGWKLNKRWLHSICKGYKFSSSICLALLGAHHWSAAVVSASQKVGLQRIGMLIYSQRMYNPLVFRGISGFTFWCVMGTGVSLISSILVSPTPPKHLHVVDRLLIPLLGL